MTVILQKFFKKDKNVDKIKPGNIFNADRDNKGKGIKIDDIIKSIKIDS